MFVFTGGMSKADQRKFREQKSRAAADLATKEHKRLMRGFADALKAIGKKYKARLAEQRAACSSEYEEIKAAADRAYREAQEKLLAERRARKSKKKTQCKIGRDLLKAQRAEEAQVAKDQRAEEKRYWAEIKQIERANKSRETERSARTNKRERRQESDQEVESNIDPRYLPAWKAVKRSIKGNDRRSRTEEFLEWVEANPDTVLHYEVAQAEKDVRRFERTQSRAKKRRYDDDVPF